MVHPDVFVKGSDYTETSIPEMPLLKKLGCEVKIIKSLKHISTTDIIHRINDINVSAVGENSSHGGNMKVSAVGDDADHGSNLAIIGDDTNPSNEDISDGSSLFG
jgi:hypothetical protein